MSFTLHYIAFSDEKGEDRRKDLAHCADGTDLIYQFFLGWHNVYYTVSYTHFCTLNWTTLAKLKNPKKWRNFCMSLIFSLNLKLFKEP